MAEAVGSMKTFAVVPPYKFVVVILAEVVEPYFRCPACASVEAVEDSECTYPVVG